MDRIQQLEAFHRADATNPVLTEDLCEAYLQAARWREARSLLLQTDPLLVTPMARYRVAVIDVAEGSFAEAEQHLTELIRSGWDKPPIKLLLAQCAAHRLDWNFVRDCLAAPRLPQLEHDVLESWCLLLIRALHHRQDWSAAVDVVRTLRQLRPVGSFSPVLIAAISSLLMDANASEDLEDWLQSIPPSFCEQQPELSASLGFLHLSQGDAGRAEAAFRRSLSMAPEMHRPQLGLGLTLAAQGQFSMAIEALRSAASWDPSHLGTWHSLAWVHLASRDVTAAEGAFARALDEDDAFGETHGGLAIISALRGEVSEAEQRIRTADRLAPAGVNAQVATALLKAGDRNLTPEVLRRVISDLARRPSSVPMLNALHHWLCSAPGLADR